MPENTPRHCTWFTEGEESLNTSDGDDVTIISFDYLDDQEILNEWAQNFRLNYESETDLVAGCVATGLSRMEYLRDRKFPTRGSTRAGDFAELLVADYLQFLLGFNVPRTRYDRRVNPDMSTAGVDIVGFKFNNGGPEIDDELITCEVKARFTASSNTLQHAIDDSKKDYEVRSPLALSAMRQRLLDRNETAAADKVARFENKTVRPYREITAAAFVCSNHVWQENLVTDAVGQHANSDKIFFTFKGENFMDLVHRLYETAYATA